MANIRGTDQSDELTGTSAQDTINGLAGDDSLYGGDGFDRLNGREGNDTLAPDFGAFDIMDDGNGDVVDGGAGDDTVHLSFGLIASTITADFSNPSVIKTLPYATKIVNVESINYAGGSGTDRATGGAYDDVLAGGLGADVLKGGDGNDQLFDLREWTDFPPGNRSADASSDELYGGDGNDSFFAGLGDRIDGGSGDDRVVLDFRGLSATISSSLIDGILQTAAGTMTFRDVESTWFRSGSGADVLIGGMGDDTIDGDGSTGTGDDYISGGLGGNDDLNGGGGNDTLEGGKGDDRLWGDDGNDIVGGEDGNDYIDGDNGADTLNGGRGDDSIIAGIGDTLDGGRGTDSASIFLRDETAGVTFALTANSVLMTTSGQIRFRDIDALNLQATDFDDMISGAAGDDRIDGALGADVLRGGSGDDDVSGAEGADLIRGDAGKDYLAGGFDDDIIFGGDGDDLLFGGYGSPFLLDEGSDRLFGGRGNDVLDGELGQDLLDGGEGIDRAVLNFTGIGNGVTVNLARKMTIATADGVKTLANVEALDLSGTAFDDIITGGIGEDIVEGRFGADRINGRGGIDTVSYVFSSEPVTVNLELGYAHGGDAEGDILLDIENLVGSYGSDILKGNAEANDIVGLGGNDQLWGGAGNDRLESTPGTLYEGGSGTDTAVVDFASADAGISLSLTSNATVIGETSTIFRSIEALDIGGTDYDDLIAGGSGNDFIRGRFGADIINGRGGSDTASYEETYSPLLIDLRDGIVQTDEFGPASGDTLISIENLVGSVVNDELRGDNDRNHLEGMAGTDSLFGRGGFDWLEGGAGDDILTGGSNADTLAGGGGSDTFRYLSISDSTHIDRDRIDDFLSGNDVIDLTVIDAVRGSSTNDAFDLIGTTMFSGRAGELRFQSFGAAADAYTLVQGDVNGDRAADLEIYLNNAGSLSGADFLV